jgi:hypothetical protein
LEQTPTLRIQSLPRARKSRVPEKFHASSQFILKTEQQPNGLFSPANRSFDPKLVRNHNSLKFLKA